MYRHRRTLQHATCTRAPAYHEQTYINTTTCGSMYQSSDLSCTDIDTHYHTQHVSELRLIVYIHRYTLPQTTCIIAPAYHVHTPVHTYSQIRQMKTDNISKFNNILANADYSSVLLADCPNYAYHSFMEIYTNPFIRACPVKSIKTPKTHIKREPWVTNGILTSSLTK